MQAFSAHQCSGRIVASAAFFLFILPSLLIVPLNGYAPALISAIAALVLAAAIARLCFVEMKPYSDRLRIAYPAILCCALLALVVCVLGGEGRLFYANADWQIRDPILRDLAINSWPFEYSVSGERLALRAPLAFYLVPASAAKLLGEAWEQIALLAHSTIILALVLALMSRLFQGRSPWGVAAGLGMVILFSGADILGSLAVNLPAGKAWPPDHMENWAWTYQFSSFITQIFWVPNHSLPGLFFAAAYLLWIDDRLPPSVPLAIVPIMGFWSPLTMLGTAAFAAHILISMFAHRDLFWRQLLLPVLAFAACLLALIYMRSGAENVNFGIGLRPFWPYIEFDMSMAGTAKAITRYVAFLTLEAGIFLAVLFWRSKDDRFGLTSTYLVAATLAICPVVLIGQNIDFCMRASIPALAILSIKIANLVLYYVRERPDFWRQPAFQILTVMLALGSFTGLSEIRRAITTRPAQTTCNFVDAWRQSAYNNIGWDNYLVSPDALPEILRPRDPSVVETGNTPPSCWTGPWKVSL